MFKENGRQLQTKENVGREQSPTDGANAPSLLSWAGNNVRNGRRGWRPLAAESASGKAHELYTQHVVAPLINNLSIFSCRYLISKNR